MLIVYLRERKKEKMMHVPYVYVHLVRTHTVLYVSADTTAEFALLITFLKRWLEKYIRWKR